MTRILASINSLEEAQLIQTFDIDIIDLKQPAEGALGALDKGTVQRIIAEIAGRCPVSATIGDLPMLPHRVAPAVADMAETGVDYIKIGFFPGHDWLACIEALSQFSDDHALIAVLFADCQPSFSVLRQLKQAGFTGVMLDTMDKRKGSLNDIMTMPRIAQFIKLAKQLDLLTGLAGSLKSSDIATLLPLHADYLGFRGALCAHHNRIAALAPNKIAALIACFHAPPAMEKIAQANKHTPEPTL
ncbi:(5-formylfuran-3-yl)methyl phosphate synthase [Methylomarinum sp. Ch1-1]|uniref:(5-formylfuran-3-yl)methyl phosphate synthase n=1 Tax=Methylomarinum roseum TaxID=3067653 RepID=A0AAU7NS47_9GAMM